MSLFPSSAGVLLGAALLVTLAGCQRTGERAGAALPDPDEAAAAAVAAYDTDGDGALSTAEFTVSPGLLVASKRMDADADGQITASEIVQHFGLYHDVDLTLMSLEAHITLDGQPLEGATVTLIPESLNGEGTKPATGVTDQIGRCPLVSEGAQYRAVQLGVYRISVSMLDAAGRETLPAKYNSESQLGIEVCNEASRAGELDFGVTLDMYSR
jgi:hypothetical protein